MPYETVKLNRDEKAEVFIDKDGGYVIEKYEIFSEIVGKWIKFDLDVMFKLQREEYDRIVDEVEFKVNNQQFSKE